MNNNTVHRSRLQRIRYKRGSNQYKKRTGLIGFFKYNVYAWFVIYALFILTVIFITKIAVPWTTHKIDKAFAQEIISPCPATGCSVQTETPEVIYIPVTPEPEVDTLNTDHNKIFEYVKAIFGRDARVAIAIQANECNPGRADFPRCKKIDNIEYSCGMWQINLDVHGPKVKGDTKAEKCENLLDPYYNTLVAYKIYKDWGSFNPWTAYKTGAYKNHLK